MNGLDLFYICLSFACIITHFLHLEELRYMVFINSFANSEYRYPETLFIDVDLLTDWNEVISMAKIIELGEEET